VIAGPTLRRVERRWDGIAAPAVVDRAWQLAQVLMLVNQAISYVSIEENAGPIEDFAEYLASWLRRVLAAPRPGSGRLTGRSYPETPSEH
jgi:hypothetical protein